MSQRSELILFVLAAVAACTVLADWCPPCVQQVRDSTGNIPYRVKAASYKPRRPSHRATFALPAARLTILQ